MVIGFSGFHGYCAVAVPVNPSRAAAANMKIRSMGLLP
jgi:hypothetical protein